MATPANQTLSEEAIGEQAMRHSRPVEYPTGDGKPMAEHDLYRDLMVYLIEALKVYFADRPDVYVSGNNFLYYVEGDPRKVVSPDCYVVVGVPRRPRLFYKMWEEGRVPNVVFEITSKKTRKEDQDTKRPLYEQRLRVPEYFQFDPHGDYLTPRLQGFRLNAEGVYEQLLLAEGRLFSAELGLALVQEGETLRLLDPRTGQFLLSPEEMAIARKQAEEQARHEAQARQEAEARASIAEVELARLRAEIEAMRRNAD